MAEQTIKTNLDNGDITSRLYPIQNIAYLAAHCPKDKTDVCLLQGTAEGLVGMIQSLIGDIDT
jgi:hypothetical protein